MPINIPAVFYDKVRYSVGCRSEVPCSYNIYPRITFQNKPAISDTPNIAVWLRCRKVPNPEKLALNTYYLEGPIYLEIGLFGEASLRT
jgi:hypothetical protein